MSGEVLGRDPSVLYKGVQLAGARDRVARNEGRLNDLEWAFLAASGKREPIGQPLTATPADLVELPQPPGGRVEARCRACRSDAIDGLSASARPAAPPVGGSGCSAPATGTMVPERPWPARAASGDDARPAGQS